MQGLELLVTVLLARSRQPPPTVAAGVPHANIAAELVSLPSGLLAMVCEAIVKLKVRPGAACVRARACGMHGRWERADEVRTGAHCPVRVGQGQSAPQGMSRPCGMLEVLLVLSVLDTGTLQVSDVVRAGPDSQRTGPLSRSSRLSTLRAGGSA